MEVIHIDVKPRAEVENKSDTDTIILVDLEDEASALSDGSDGEESLQGHKISANPGRKRHDFIILNEPNSEDQFAFKIHKIKSDDKISTSNESEADSQSRNQAIASGPILTMSKEAWPENSNDDDGSPEKGNYNIQDIPELPSNFIDEETQNEGNGMDKEKPSLSHKSVQADEKPSLSNASIQADLGRKEGKGSGRCRDSRIILSPSSLPSLVDIGTDTCYLNFHKAKSKKGKKKKQEKCSVFVVPCDDDGTTQDAQNGGEGNNGIDNSCSNPSVTPGVHGDSSAVENQHNTHAEIPAWDDLSGDFVPRKKTYFHYLFESYFWLALCPKRITKDTWIGNWILFMILSIAAILHDAIRAKNEYIWTDDVLLLVVAMGSYTIGLIFRIYFVYLIIFRFEDIKKLANLMSIVSPNLTKSKVIVGVAIPVATSIIMAILYSVAATIEVYERHGQEYDIDDLLVWRAFRLSQAILMWNKDDRANQSAIISAGFDENDVITPQEVCLGITGFFIHIAGNLYGTIIRDISIVVAVSYLGLTFKFVRMLNSKNKPTEEECNEIWNYYKTLRTVTKFTKKVYGIFLLLLHVEDVFLVSHFMFENIVRGEAIYVSILRACLLARVTYFYIAAAIVWRVNAKFKKWILKNFPGANTLFFENSEYVTTSNALEQLKTEPIAIGSILFDINDSFLAKFVAYICSAFFFFADHDE